MYEKHTGSSKQWSTQDDQRVDWRETLQRRIRNCCRVVQQGQLKVKGKPPQWIAMLPWNMKESGESEAESEVDKDQGGELQVDEADQGELEDKADKKGEEKYEYGFSVELMLPWRQLGHKSKETGLPITIGADEVVMGEWPDGHKHAIPGITSQVLKHLLYKKCMHAGNMYETEHKETRHKIALVQKVDRSLLMAITEQSKQVLMVRMNLFGAIQDEGRRLAADDPVCKAAYDFMMPILEKFASGSVSRAELIPLRNAELMKLGLVKPSQGSSVQKRPASHAPSSSSDHASKVMKGQHVKEEEKESWDEGCSPVEPPPALHTLGAMTPFLAS